MEINEIKRRFEFFPPQGNQSDKYKSVRDLAFQLALCINIECQSPRECALAITKLEESLMWANKGISREEE